ncbi:MAG: hypothetical protein M1827_002638 [Pycnora praestabilis]|nr:MAG: hypothetical protein M1827_002638 [Pycnora praestabilis]
MARLVHEAGDVPKNNAPEKTDSSLSLDQVTALLKSKDDTSRFVGLALVKSILDNQRPSNHRHPAIVSICWDAISPKFLDRLLQAGNKAGRTQNEAQDMIGLAVAIIDAFIGLLPPVTEDDEKLVDRTGALVSASLHSSPEVTNRILDILKRFSSNPRGAVKLLEAKELSSLVEIAPQEPSSLPALQFALVTAGMQVETQYIVQAQLDNLIPALIISFKDNDAVKLLDFLVEIYTRLPVNVLPPSPSWLKDLSNVLRHTLVIDQTSVNRTPATLILSRLLQMYPTTFPRHIFRASAPSISSQSTNPSLSLLLSLLLVNIRSSIPSHLELLSAPYYSNYSNARAAEYDILTAFVAYLMQSLDDDEGLLLPPDQLLKFRKDVAETMSLTIEFLRDRWDAESAGIDGSKNIKISEKGEEYSIKGKDYSKMATDSLTLATIRALAIWLREDDNESLRNEAAGIIDVLLGLYSPKGKAEPEQYLSGEESEGQHSHFGERLEFSSPVLIAFEGILCTSGGIEAFLAGNGWAILWGDLKSILTSNEDSLRGIEIVRVLLQVTEADVTGPSREEWMSIITTASGLPKSQSNADMELQVAVWQLSVELLSRAPAGMIKRHSDEAKKITRVAEEVLRNLTGEKRKDDIVDGLSEVIEGLEGLGLGCNLAIEN